MGSCVSRRPWASTQALTGSEGGTRVPQDLDIPRHHGSCVQKEVSLSFPWGCEGSSETRGGSARAGRAKFKSTPYQFLAALHKAPPRVEASPVGGAWAPNGWTGGVAEG